MHSFTVFVVSVLVAQAALAAPVIAPEPAPVEEAPSLGSTIAGGIATGAALSNILNKIESLFKRDRSSPLSDDDKKQILVALVNKAAQVSQAQKRTLRQSIVEGAADGATGAISDNANPLITELLNEIESHINIREVDSRGLVSSGANAAIGAGASAGTHSIVSTILDKIESLFKRDDWGQDFQGVGPAKREPVPLPLPSGVGSDIAGGVAAGAGGALLSNLLTEIENHFNLKREPSSEPLSFPSSLATQRASKRSINDLD